VTTAVRLKWLPCTRGEFGMFRSSCGRFTVASVCMNPAWQGYWGLTDAQTGREYPCRSEESAKTMARNLINYGHAGRPREAGAEGPGG
jgi:hypothetical protein